MSEKNLLIAVVVVLCLIAAGVGGYAKFKDNLVEPSPSPSTQALQFGQQQGQPSSPQQKQTQNMIQYQQFPGVLPAAEITNKKAVLETSKGIIEFEIFPATPKTSSNFVFLAKDKFYDGLTFHRVEPGFVIQGGDPVGNGTGGPGYKFEDEPVTLKYDRGIVAMANSGPDTNGSQFFIMLADTPLPPNYTIFGKVTTGMEVVDKIQVGDTMNKVIIEPLK